MKKKQELTNTQWKKEKNPSTPELILHHNWSRGWEVVERQLPPKRLVSTCNPHWLAGGAIRCRWFYRQQFLSFILQLLFFKHNINQRTSSTALFDSPAFPLLFINNTCAGLMKQFQTTTTKNSRNQVNGVEYYCIRYTNTPVPVLTVVSSPFLSRVFTDKQNLFHSSSSSSPPSLFTPSSLPVFRTSPVTTSIPLSLAVQNPAGLALWLHRIVVIV